MITTSLASILLRPSPPDPVELARVRAFVKVAHIGLVSNGDSIVPAPLATPPRDIDEPENGIHVRKYWWNGTMTAVDTRTGLVVSYIEHDPPGARAYGPRENAVPRQIGDAEALLVAQRFHAATGNPFGIKPWSLRDHQGDHGESLGIDFVPTWRGVPYDRTEGGYLEVDREDGRLKDYNFHAWSTDLPRPPSSVVPRVAPEAARLAALGQAVALAGSVVEESQEWPFALCIGSPAVQSGGGFLSFLSPLKAQRVKGGEARLVYSGQIVSSQGADAGGTRLTVMVDALDGRVLSVRDSAFGRGGKALAPANSLRPATAANLWRVALPKGAWTPSATATLTPDPAPVPAKGIKLALTDGRAAFPALYDPATGLLAISGRAYRPGPALAALLKRRAKA